MLEIFADALLRRAVDDSITSDEQTALAYSEWLEAGGSIIGEHEVILASLDTPTGEAIRARLGSIASRHIPSD